MNATARRFLSLALLAYGLYDLSDPGRGSLLAGVDLAIHETGHIVFGPFGEFIGFAGGTLFQLLMPAAFVVYFARRGDLHSASVALWWVGQNCGHIAVYVADARAQELPLVGGGEHDWAYLLGELGRLSSDQGIARAFKAAGFLLIAGSTIWGLMTAARSSTEAALVDA
ncbi:MAG: hypothetical protein ABIT20_04125 [Gemmatimonadaceae bacterium]